MRYEIQLRLFGPASERITDDIRVMKANINPISHRALMFQTFSNIPIRYLVGRLTLAQNGQIFLLHPPDMERIIGSNPHDLYIQGNRL